MEITGCYAIKCTRRLSGSNASYGSGGQWTFLSTDRTKFWDERNFFGEFWHKETFCRKCHEHNRAMMVAMAKMKVSFVRLLHLLQFPGPQHMRWEQIQMRVWRQLYSHHVVIRRKMELQEFWIQNFCRPPPPTLLPFNSPAQIEIASKRSSYATVDVTALWARTRHLSVQMHFCPLKLLCATWIIFCATTEIVLLIRMFATEDGTAKMEMKKKPSAKRSLRKNAPVKSNSYQWSEHNSAWSSVIHFHKVVIVFRLRTTKLAGRIHLYWRVAFLIRKCATEDSRM